MSAYAAVLDNLGKRHRLPILRQTEAAECGLVCLAMIAAYWGAGFDVGSIRQRFAVSARGMSLDTLVRIGRAVGLTSRAVRVDVEDLSSLRLPAILHWEFKHFVVLKSVGRRFTIHDPRMGLRHVRPSELSAKFTGVALEVWPAADFNPSAQVAKTDWRTLLGNPKGFGSLFAKLLMIGVATQILSLLSPIITQWGIDNVAASGDLDLLSVLAIALAALLILQAVLTALRGWSITGATARFILNWKMHIFGHMAHLPLDYFQLRRVGDITSRYESVESIINILNDSFVEGVLDSLTGVAAVTVLFLYSVPLALITCGGAFIYLIIRIFRYGTIRELTQQSLLADARENSTLIETIRGIRAIKLFGREKGREQEWVAAAADEANADLALSRTQVLFRLLSSFIGGAEQVAVFWLSMQMVTTGKMTIGMIVAFASYRAQFYSSVAGLVDNYISLQVVKLHADRVADIVVAKPEEDLSRSETTERIGMVDATLILNSVAFRYGEFDAFALRNISIRIAQGESVALVGKSGCGKSSLVSLLVGLYQPSSGDILYGGIPLYAMGLDTVRKQIAVVMQDDMLFSGTVAQNISSFDPDMDLERVQRCAELARIHLDIMLMPMGYGSLITDMGSSLSGGQRQRVCIARALYRFPQILIMDEATSHLDLETERGINTNISKLGITRIVVAHRLDTIKSASRLILLDRGEIVADSAHNTKYDKIIEALNTGDRFWEDRSSDTISVS